MLLRCLRFLLLFTLLTSVARAEEDAISVYAKKIEGAVRGLATEPVNNAQVVPPFPVANKEQTAWDVRLKEYIYAYQVRYGNIGDRFIMPEDADVLLATLPHGTTESPIVDPVKQDAIAKIFEEEYEESIANQYFRMQYRVMAPTMR